MRNEKKQLLTGSPVRDEIQDFTNDVNESVDSDNNVRKLEDDDVKRDTISKAFAAVLSKGGASARGGVTSDKDVVDSANEKPRRIQHSDTSLTCVVVHECDLLEGFPGLFAHPVVKVHIVDAGSGKPFTSEVDPEERVSLTRTTLPLQRVSLTTAFRCRWEEKLYFALPFDSMTDHSGDQALILFQIMNEAMDGPVSQSAKNVNKLKGNFEQLDAQATNSNNAVPDKTKNQSFFEHLSMKKRSSLKTIAWGFLKICGANNRLNVGERLRLQLFYPYKSSDVKVKDLFNWWKYNKRSKYPSTMYISILKRKVNEDTKGRYKKFGSIESVTKIENGNGSQNAGGISPITDEKVKWSKPIYKPFSIPNKVVHVFRGQSCLVTKFSHNGLKLACGMGPIIVIYHVLRGTILLNLKGHLGIIYDIDWAVNDDKIATASGDSTARVWEDKSGNSACNILVHPAYVYACRFLSNDGRLICTGCFDHVLRIWYETQGAYDCIQEFNKHSGFVNSLCLNKERNTLYSGDQKGIICVWNIDCEPIMQGNVLKSSVLSFSEDIKIRGIAGNVINTIVYHPGNHRLLIHTRNSHLFMVNHRHWKITHTLGGPLNLREQIRSCLSPCGRYVLMGGEDSCLMIWNSDTGNVESTISDLPLSGTYSCVDFHPLDNYIAVCCYSRQSESNSVVIVSKFDSESNKELATQSVSLPPLNSSANASTPTTSKESRSDEASSEIWKRTGNCLISKLDAVLKMATEETGKIPHQSGERRRDQLDTGNVDVAVVLKNFRATEPQELSVKQGNFVSVVDRSDKQWWRIKTADGVGEGLVPSVYLGLTLDSQKLLPARQHTQSTDDDAYAYDDDSTQPLNLSNKHTKKDRSTAPKEYSTIDWEDERNEKAIVKARQDRKPRPTNARNRRYQQLEHR